MPHDQDFRSLRDFGSLEAAEEPCLHGGAQGPRPLGLRFWGLRIGQGTPQLVRHGVLAGRLS